MYDWEWFHIRMMKLVEVVVVVSMIVIVWRTIS